MSTDSLNYPKSNINAYLELTKPSIIYLLVLTAATSMFLAGSFSTNLSQALTGILGIGMIAASSAAINQILDVSIDSKMKRTGNRPLVRNLISVKNASVFAFMLFALGAFILLFFNNSCLVVYKLILDYLRFFLHKDSKIYWHPKYRHWGFGRSNAAIAWLGSSDGIY